MKSKRMLVIIIQCVLILVISGIYLVIQKVAVNPTACYVYKNNYKEGAVLQEGDFEKKLIPKDGIDKSMITDLSALNGKVLDASVIAGHYVYGDEFIEEEYADTFKQEDTTQLRKYTIPVTRETALGGDIKSGDYVDLMFSGEAKATDVSKMKDKINANNQSEDTSLYYTKIFMSKVRVYKVTTSTGSDYVNASEMPTNPEDGESSGGDGADPAFVTLAVTAEQLQEIKTRQNIGDVTIVGLFKDTVESTSEGFTMTDKDVYTEYADPETNKGATETTITSNEPITTETPTTTEESVTQ